jgi:amino acid adenylation domain-containing protein
VSLTDEILAVQRGNKRLAVIDGAARFTFAEVDSLTASLAVRLQRLGIGKGHRIALAMDKSAKALIWIWAVNRAGAAYVPVDTQAPIRRSLTLLDDCRPTLVVGDPNWIRTLEEGEDSESRVPLATAWELDRGGDLMSDPSIALDRTPAADGPAIAYVIFTSGSTGSPKGVVIREESLAVLIGSAINLAGYREDMRYLAVCSFCFDGSLTDIFCPLSVGATTVVQREIRSPKDLVSAMARYEITDTLLPSALVRLLTSKFSGLTPGLLPFFRTLWFGGEGCPIHVLRQVKASIPQVRFIHGYGPTETTHTATAFVCDDLGREQGEFLPIGTALPRVETLLLTSEGKEAEAGERGELYIGGIQVMEGYLNDPEATKRALVRNPGGRSGLFYRTGDFITLGRDGLLYFEGREDDLIKTRGFRVSTTEIEKRLLEIDGVIDAYVLASPDAVVGKRLAAAVVLAPSQNMTERDIVARLGESLPRYMIPERIRPILGEAVPRNRNGKVDRQALRELLEGEGAVRSTH